MKNSTEAQQGSQNLTSMSQRVKDLLQSSTITREQLNELTEQERVLFEKELTKRFNRVKTGIEKEKLWNFVEPIATEQTKNDYWEGNHKAITSALDHYVNQHNKLPSKSVLAEITGLSRQTIHKHLNEYKQAAFFQFQQEAFSLLTTGLLAKLYNFAAEGNVQAAKLYFEMTGSYSPTKRTIEQHSTTNNFIQINNTLFSQESLKQISPEKLAEVERLLHKELSK